MSRSDIDLKLLYEEDLFSWVCKEHIQVFGTDPTKHIKILSGFIHKNHSLPNNLYEIVINHAIKCTDPNEDTIKAKHVFLTEEEILQEWTFYISQQDYEVFMKTNTTERTNNMHFSQIQKENYIVKVQYTRSQESSHRYTPGSILPTIAAFNNNRLYPTKYNYAVPLGLSLKVGDYVLTGNDTDDLNIAKVVEIVEDNLKNMNDINKATKFVYGKADISNIIKQVETAERATYLKNKIDELKRTFEERKMLEIMAQNDPEAAKLINEYKNLVQFLPK